MIMIMTITMTVIVTKISDSNHVNDYGDYDLPLSLHPEEYSPLPALSTLLSLPLSLTLTVSSNRACGVALPFPCPRPFTPGLLL